MRCYVAGAEDLLVPSSRLLLEGLLVVAVGVDAVW